jgi:glycosyltransferase involved in cell wall biosynthesis
MMKILALSHFLWFGGAQISNIEFFDLLKNLAELKIIICDSTDIRYVIDSKKIEIYKIPCKTIRKYPIMNIEEISKLVEWADIVWITDVEYIVSPRIKRLKNVPLIAHLHSYALICPWWGALYRSKETCLKRCSIWRITRCKQGINQELARIGLLNHAEADIYWLLDLVKAPLDFLEWKRYVNYDLYKSIDGFMPVSQALLNVYVKHFPEFKCKPSMVIYNPVIEPLKYVNPRINEPYKDYILYASGSDALKGPHLLLKAWQEVSKEFRDLELFMIGCKNTWIEEKAHKMNLKNIIFAERLPSREYYHLMYKAKAVVMPSIWPEPFGRIPVEANRLGVPAIVSNRGALPEIIEDGVTGVVSEASSDSLAEAIVEVISRSWDRGKIIENTWKRINPHNIILKMLDFFEMILSRM